MSAIKGVDCSLKLFNLFRFVEKLFQKACELLNLFVIGRKALCSTFDALVQILSASKLLFAGEITQRRSSTFIVNMFFMKWCFLCSIYAAMRFHIRFQVYLNCNQLQFPSSASLTILASLQDLGCLPFTWKTQKFQLKNQMVRTIPFGVLLKL